MCGGVATFAVHRLIPLHLTPARVLAAALARAFFPAGCGSRAAILGCNICYANHACPVCCLLTSSSLLPTCQPRLFAETRPHSVSLSASSAPCSTLQHHAPAFCASFCLSRGCLPPSAASGYVFIKQRLCMNRAWRTDSCWHAIFCFRCRARHSGDEYSSPVPACGAEVNLAPWY